MHGCLSCLSESVARSPTTVSDSQLRKAATARRPLSADCIEKVGSSRLRIYAKSEPGNPLIIAKISSSDAYFSAVETMADFFNTIGHKRSASVRVQVGFDARY